MSDTKITQAQLVPIVEEAWIYPTYQNGWVRYNAEYGDARYMKDSQGFVHLDGMVKSGTTVIFTLPVGYRPGYRNLLGRNSSGGLARVDVLAVDGTVSHLSGGSNGWISLHGITFRADN